MVLMRVLNLKFLHELPAILTGTSKFTARVAIGVEARVLTS